MATKQKPESYFESVPLGNRWKLDRKLDFEHGDVQIHLGRIAALMIEWEGRVADELGLTESEVADIKEKYSGKLNLQKRAALQKWQEKFGREASYRNLITAFLNADKGSYAEVVCAQLQPLCDQRFSTVVGSTPRNDVTGPQDELTDIQSSGIAVGTSSEELQLLESYPNFQCPCNKCSLESYLINGCPKVTPQGKLFPFLNVKGLNEDECKKLEHKLLSDSKNIITKFASFRCAVEKSLCDRNVDPERLASCVLSIAGVHSDVVPLLEEHEEKLERADSISKIFLILRHYISFFNFEILEHIIDSLGARNDRAKLKQYKSDFQEFCKRSVFEVQPGLFWQGLAVEEKRQTLAMKLTPRNKARVMNKKSPTLITLFTAKEAIGKILGISTSSLYLCRVDEGCVEMLFLVPRCVFKVILQKLSNRQTMYELMSHGLSVVQERTQTYKMLPQITSNVIFDVEVSVGDKRPKHSDAEFKPVPKRQNN